MPDDKGAKEGKETPASSPEANPEDAKATPSNDDAKPEVVTPPFHEMMKNPEFQEFYNRQLQKEVSDSVGNVLTKMGVSPNAPKPETDEDVKLLMSEFEISEEKAKKLAIWRDNGVKKTTKGIEEKLQSWEIAQRFGAIFNQYPDAKQYDKKMLALFGTMSEMERNFVLNSEDGPAFLYEKAKRSAGVLPVSTKIAGTNASTKAVSPATKMGDTDPLIDQALEAWKKGDRAGYEKIMKSVIRK